MICPKCGNTVGQDEGFCGLCGTPNISPLSLPAGNNFPSSTTTIRGNQQPGQPGTFNTQAGMAPSLFGVPQPQPHQLPMRPPTSPLAENSSLMQQPVQPRPVHIANQRGQYTPQQQGNFYHDATEAIKPSPDIRTLGNYASPGTYTPQQPISQDGQYRSSGYLQPPFNTGQQYYSGTRIQPPPSQQRQQPNAIMIVVSVCCLVVFLGAVAIGGFILTKQKEAQVNKTSSVNTVTRATTLVSTATPQSSPTPISTPSPTVAPTPTPDPGFVWCGQLCVTGNFTTEYPGTWQAGMNPTTNAIQFANPAQTDQYVLFKGQGPAASDAGTLVNNELQASYAVQPGYTAPTSTLAATISGETWIKAVAYYQGASQQEEVEVLATVHNSKAYVIDLNAPTSQFVAINGQAFVYILEKFQFSA